MSDFNMFLPRYSEQFRKALESAEAAIQRAEAAAEASVQKAAERQMSSAELETAMLNLVEVQKLEGESSAQAFSRLAKSDPAVRSLYAAADLQRVHEIHAETIRKREAAPQMLKSAENLIEAFVQKNRRSGESVEQAYARLAHEPTFKRLYGEAREASLDLDID